MNAEPSVPTPHDHVALAMASHTCLLLHDAATKNILWANPAACEMLEWSVEELRPLKAPDMSSAGQQYNRVIGRAWLQKAVECGTNRIEWHYRSRTGRVIPTDAIATRVELERGPAVMVQFRDIEREQQVEQNLRQATTYLESLARHTSTIALMLDTSGQIVFGTDSAVSLIGGDLGEPLEHLGAYARLRVDDELVDWDTLLTHCAPATNVQLEIPRPGMDATWLEGTLERLQEDPHDLLMILHDTSRRRSDQQRRHREQEQVNYHARYNAMGDMAMAIAHELGQPLAAARNYLAALGRRPDASSTERLNHAVDGAIRQIERAAAIVNSLRSFVGNLEHVQEEVDLNDVVEECLHFIRLRAKPVSVDVQLRPSISPVVVRCERVLTGQVVMNLCFNAIDEMAGAPAADRRITITTEQLESSALFAVDDNGRGIDRDPFSESITSKEQGSGLGLALSHRIIARQHGVIWAESRDEGGSRFAFTLPLAPTAEATRQRA